MTKKWIVEVVESFDAVIELGPLQIRDMTGRIVDIVGPARTCVLPRFAGQKFVCKTKAAAMQFIATQPDKLRLEA